MAINLCRFDPKRFVPLIRQVYKEHPELAKGKGKDMAGLSQALSTTTDLGQVVFDAQANEAARQNNAEQVAKAEAEPTKGGNVAKLTELSGEEKSEKADEFTMVKFEAADPMIFVATQLALDWEREGDKGKKSPLLDKEVGKVGISNKAHPKTVNLIQVLYVKNTGNAIM